MNKKLKIYNQRLKYYNTLLDKITPEELNALINLYTLKYDSENPNEDKFTYIKNNILKHYE